MEALIVCMDMFLKSSSLETKNVIIRSDGVRCAVKELRGMSEVCISAVSSKVEEKSYNNKESEDKKEQKMFEPTRTPRGQSSGREQSCPPASNWRNRLIQDQETEKKKDEIKVALEQTEAKKFVITKDKRRSSNDCGKGLIP